MELIKRDADSKTDVMVEWTSDCGEGLCGEYNPDDPNDIALLRFDISVRRKGDKDWEPIDDASYCTQVPVDTPDDILKEGLEMIMEEIFDDVVAGNGIKKACEQMSWISVQGIKDGVWERKWVLD